MAYVSNVLTHWVGRGKSPDQQYTILTQSILKKKELLYSACPWHFRSKYGGVERSEITMISFADIPFSECARHCDKYSHFGISFDKRYLANCLACPVGYVQHPFIHNNYSYIYHGLHGVKGLLSGTEIPEGKRKGEKFNPHELLTRFQYIMAFLEDHSVDEFKYNEPPAKLPLSGQEGFFENPSALYYEREWRMVLSGKATSLPWHEAREGKTYFRFEGQYVKWVIVPREYVPRLRDEQTSIFGDYPLRGIPSIVAYEDLAFL